MRHMKLYSRLVVVALCMCQATSLPTSEVILDGKCTDTPMHHIHEKYHGVRFM